MSGNTGTSLTALLQKLTEGDDAAAEAVFRKYEPYLRMVVRRQLSGPLRAKFDSFDVVQSVWADVIQGFRDADWRFSDVNHLRAFLVKLTRNRFIDRARQHRVALAHEQSLEAMDENSPTDCSAKGLAVYHGASPAEELQADELWQQLIELCPPGHRQLLTLKREGKTLAEIAERTGLHPGSIRRIIYDLERKYHARRKSETLTF